MYSNFIIIAIIIIVVIIIILLSFYYLTASRCVFFQEHQIQRKSEIRPQDYFWGRNNPTIISGVKGLWIASFA